MRQDAWHVSDTDLEEYVFGRLVEPELARIEEHMLVCEECRKRLEQTDCHVAAMKAAAAKLK